MPREKGCIWGLWLGVYPGIMKDGRMRWGSSAGRQRDGDGKVAAVCVRLCGLHGKWLDTTFAISTPSFFISFFSPPTLTVWS